MRRRDRTLACACALLAIGLFAAPASGVTYTFSTPIAGDPVPVSVSIVDAPGGNAVDVDVSIPPGQGDLLGFFANTVPDSLVAQMSVSDPSGLVTQWQFAANQVWKVGGGNVMAPVKNWDLGLRFASQGSAGGVVTQASFRLSAPGLTVSSLTQASNQGWVLGIRIQGTTGPEGSAKIGLPVGQNPDGEAPTVRIDAPVAGTLFGASPVAVTGTFTGTPPVNVTVDGVAAQVSGASFSAWADLVEGENTITAAASNAAGSASDDVAVILDTTAPLVTIQAPPPGTLTTEATVVVAGTVSDASAIESVTVNGTPVALVGGSFSAEMALVLGENPITVEATDAAGNPGSAATSVTRGTAPVLTLTQPAPGFLTRLSPIEVRGQVTGSEPVTVTVSGVAATLSGGEFVASVPLAEGTNTLTATATNAFGSDGASVEGDLDTTPPSVSIAQPADGALTAESQILVTGSVTDASAIASFTLNGAPAPLAGGSFSQNVSLAPGANAITAVATDAAGNSRTVSVGVVRGAVPTVAIGSPADGFLTRQASIQVTGSVTGDPVPEVSVNGVAATVTGGAFSATVSLTEGSNPLTATATNALGSAAASVSVTRDSTPPVVTFLSPANGQEFTEQPIGVFGSVTDASAIVGLRVNGAAIQAGTAFATTVPLGSGSNSITVEATDAAGNVGSATVTVSFASGGPALSIQIQSPPNGVFLAQTPVAVAGTVSDPGALVTVNGATALVTGGQFVAPAVSLQAGQNTLVATATRGAETASSQVSVTYDVPPRVAITSPPGGAVVGAAQVDVEGIVDDLAATVDVNGVAAEIGAGGRFVARAVPLNVGANSLVASAVDLLGGRGSHVVQVTRQDGAPPRLRVVLVDPARCAFGADPCTPVALVADDLESFAAQLAGLGLPLEGFSPVPERPHVGSAPFHAYVFSEAGGEATLDLAGATALVQVRQSPRSLDPIGGLSADLAAAGLDPSLAEDLVPQDLEAVAFARFDLDLLPTDGGGAGPIGGPLFNGLVHPALRNPIAIAIEDFDGDGNADLAAAAASTTVGQASGGVWVRLGRGDGTFGAETILLEHVEMNALDSGDVNGDGHVDLVAITRNSPQIVTWLGNGDGTFQADVRTALDTGFPLWVQLAHLDGDGRLDLLYLRSGFNVVQARRGNGDGTFAAATSHAVGTSPLTTLTEDFDADGDLDVVVSNSGSNDVSLLRNDGLGGFAAQVRLPAGSFPRGLLAEDLNGDGRRDLVVANGISNDLSLLMGNGNGTFQAQVRRAVHGGPSLLDSADLDGDGARDLVVGGGAGIFNEWRVLFGQGNGTFPRELSIPANKNGYWIEVVELNGDGRPDYVVLDESQGSRLSTYLNQGGGRIGISLAYADVDNFNGGSSNRTVALGDLDEDGDPDLVRTSATHDDLVVLLNAGDGAFTSVARYPAGDEPTHVEIADLDGDGHLDVVVVLHDASAAAVLLGNGDGTLGAATPFTTYPSPRWVTLADVDLDGALDLLTTSDGSNTTSGRLSVLLGNGDGTFAAKQDYFAGRDPSGIAAADFTGDGIPDLVVSDSGLGTAAFSGVYLLRGNGDGRFGFAQSLGSGGQNFMAAAADVNDDGFMDAVLGRSGVNGIGLLLGRGNGTFEPARTLPTGAGPRYVAVLDLDFDGALDIVSANVNNIDGTSFSVLLGDGDGGFESGGDFAARGFETFVTGDVDGDGATDFVEAHPDGAVVYLNRDPQPAAEAGPLRLIARAGGASGSLALLADRQAPVVTIASPVDGSSVAGSRVTITGHLRDDFYRIVDTSYFAEVAWRAFDDLGVELASGTAPVVDGTFSIRNLAVGAGEHCVRVEATDAAGQRGVAETCFTPDPSAPGVALVSPLDGQGVVADSVDVDLLFGEPATLVAVNGAPDGRSFDAGLALGALSVPLALGPNTFQLDFQAGARSFSLAFTVFRLGALPSIRIIEPADGEFLAATSAVVIGRVPLGTPYVEVNGLPATIAADGITFSVQVPLREGENELRAVELVSGTASVVRVTRDTVPPEFLGLVPPDGTRTDGEEIELLGELDEPALVSAIGALGSVMGATVPMPGDLSDPFGGSFVHHFELAPLALAPGANPIVVRAVDRAGNVAERTLGVSRDVAALRLLSPAPGSLVDGSRTDLLVEATEPVTVTALYAAGRRMAAFDGLALAAGATQLPGVPLVPGPNDIRIVYQRGVGGAEVLAFELESSVTESATLSGTVADARDQAGLAGAKVMVSVNGVVLVATADAGGRYTITVEPGPLQAAVSYPGYTAATFALELAAGADVVQNAFLVPWQVTTEPIPQPPTGSIPGGNTAAAQLSGRVTDASTGEALAGAIVELVTAQGGTASALSAGDGSYLIAGVPAGEVFVRSGRAGYRSDTFQGLALPGGVLAHDFALQPQSAPGVPTGITITGTVTEAATGAPLGGALVELYADEVARSVETGADGTYTFADAPQGGMQLRAARQGYLAQGSFVFASAGQTVTLDFALDVELPLEEPTTSTILGTVADAATGEPVPDAYVTITTQYDTLFTSSDSSGSFVQPGIPDGPITIQVAQQGYLPAFYQGEISGVAVYQLSVALQPIPVTTPNEAAILVPPDGTVTDFDAVTVMGTVLQPGSFVTVNGIAAEVVGNRFVARGVSLEPGPNVIDAAITSLGLPTIHARVNVERSDTPELTVRIVSPPAGATIPGAGVVVRGFVSARAARTWVAGSFVAPIEGVFEATEVRLPVGSTVVSALATTRDGTQEARHDVPVRVTDEEPLFRLDADPASGVAPLATTLELFVARGGVDVAQISFDTNGDHELDVTGAQSRLEVSYEEPRPYLARAYVTLRDGVEFSAAKGVRAHLASVQLRTFAEGNPVDLARGPDGSLYVLDGAGARVSRYDADGTLLGSFGSGGAGPEQMSGPQALAVAPDGKIYVADTGNDRIQVFDPDGTHVQSFVGGGPLQFDAPAGVLVTADALYVSDTGNDRVQRIDPASNRVSWFGVPRPLDLANGPGLELLVSSPTAGLFALLGDRLVTPPGFATASAEARPEAPVEAATGPDGFVVIDSSADRLLLLDRRLAFRRALDGVVATPRAALPGLRPEVESVYVADGRRVAEIALPTDSPLPVVEALRDRLAAQDVDGALALIDVSRRSLYQGIYERIAAQLPAAAAAMSDPQVYELRDGYAIVMVKRTEEFQGQNVVNSYPIHLVRSGDGSWRILSY